MTNAARYVPILKAKAGEFQALRDLAPDIGDTITPCFDVVAPSEFDDRTVDSVIGALPERLAASWGTARSLLVDGYAVEEDTMADGEEPASALLAGCRELGVQAVPVTGLQRVTEYQEAVAAAIEADERGVCIRLLPEDLSEPQSLESRIGALLSALKTERRSTDLLIDYGPISEELRVPVQNGLIAQLNALPNVAQWRSLTFAASAFPQDLSKIPSGQVTLLPRAEWTMWSYLNAHSGSLTRLPGFGDYGIAHPNVVDIDPTIMRMSPNIRYTHDEVWVIAKGVALSRKSDTKQNPPSREQYPALSRTIVSSQWWRGAAFSAGDAFIAQCAEGKGGPGNATTWRGVGTVHHLTTVARQLASLHGV